MLDALAKCGRGSLRTVFLSQNFGRLRDVLTALEGSVCYIRSRDLLLSEADVAAYARQLGIALSPQALRTVHQKTDGWAGAAELYRGEAYSVQGRFEESDIQAYQAAFLSEQAGNATATYGAALLLGINAIYRSDVVGLQKAVDYLENKAQSYAFLRGTSLGNYMVETVRGYLLGLMMETGRSALWTQGEADSLADFTFTNFMIKTCRITDLLLKRNTSGRSPRWRLPCSSTAA